MIYTTLKHYMYDFGINAFFDRLLVNFHVTKSNYISWDDLKVDHIIRFTRPDEDVWLVGVIYEKDVYYVNGAKRHSITARITNSNIYEPDDYVVYETEGWIIELVDKFGWI